AGRGLKMPCVCLLSGNGAAEIKWRAAMYKTRLDGGGKINGNPFRPVKTTPVRCGVQECRGGARPGYCFGRIDDIHPAILIEDEFFADARPVCLLCNFRYRDLGTEKLVT